MRELNVNEIKEVNGGIRNVIKAVVKAVAEVVSAATSTDKPVSPSRYTGDFHG